MLRKTYGKADGKVLCAQKLETKHQKDNKTKHLDFIIYRFNSDVNVATFVKYI